MMQMPIPDALAQALGWTLVHSLWQATLIALVLMLALPRLRSPQVRYRAAYGALFSVLLAAAATFAWMYGPADGSAPTVVSDPSSELIVNDLGAEQTASAFAFPALSEWLEAYYPVVVTLWLMGFGLFLLRLCGGLFYISRLRREGLFLVETEWQECVARLSERLALSRPVALFQSALVYAPVAIGYLKPVVLLPVGLLNQLNPAEVEAVLAHELAHIARRDWVFNLLQAFIESVFYFHPAVWWMSGIVRREREDCCDDTAVALCGSPLHYAKALLRVQEMAVSATAAGLALGLDGGPATAPARRRMLLLERVRRILNQPQHKSHNMEKSVATAVLLALLLLVGLRANTPKVIESALAQISDLAPDFLTTQTNDYQMLGDSLPKPKGKQKITREDDSRRVEAEFQDGQVTRLNIDGKEIPATEFDQHREVTEGLLRDVTPPPPPPAPPAAGRWYWGDTPAPPAPPGSPTPRAWPAPPAPPGAPAPSAPPRISTLKNSDGSTILHIENGDDAPVEIRIKDGETWVDGKKLDEGQSLDLPELSGNLHGFSFGSGSSGGGFFYAPAEGFHFQGLEGLHEGLEGLRHLEGLDEAELEELKQLSKIDREEMLRAKRETLEEVRRSMERSREDQRRDLEHQRREMERAIKEQQREMERAQKESKRVLEEAKREYERAIREQQRAMQEQERAMRQAKIEMAKAQKEMAEQTAYWGNQLHGDGLISDPKHYSMQLNSKQLTVDGKKQSDELHRKYLDLYEKRTGGKNKLGKNSWFSINTD